MSSAGRGFQGWDSVSFQGAGQKEPTEKGRPASGARHSGRSPSSNEEEDEDLYLRSQVVEQVEEEARKTGYDAGYADGLEKARADMAPLREAWLSWAARIPGFESERLKALLPEMVTILSKALERILGEEGRRPEAFRGLLERMVGEYASGRDAELRISEGDHHLLDQFDSSFSQDLAARGVRLLIGPELFSGQVELRFPDRIVSFDPEAGVDSFRRTLSRANLGLRPKSPSSDGEDEFL